DLPTERLVQRALRTLLADRTAIIIAHRLSTVEIADRVLVVDAGRIVEDGPPAVLVGSGGHYGGLHRAWVESLAGRAPSGPRAGLLPTRSRRICLRAAA